MIVDSVTLEHRTYSVLELVKFRECVGSYKAITLAYGSYPFSVYIPDVEEGVKVITFTTERVSNDIITVLLVNVSKRGSKGELTPVRTRKKVFSSDMDLGEVLNMCKWAKSSWEEVVKTYKSVGIEVPTRRSIRDISGMINRINFYANSRGKSVKSPDWSRIWSVPSSYKEVAKIDVEVERVEEIIRTLDDMVHDYECFKPTASSPVDEEKYKSSLSDRMMLVWYKYIAEGAISHARSCCNAFIASKRTETMSMFGSEG